MRRIDIRIIVLALTFAILLFVPLLGEVFWTRLVTRIMIFGIAAISLDIILGYGGLVSFGHAAFLGIGAYVAAILTFHGITSAWITWPAAVAASGLGALAIGAVSLRTSGVYFIMITLAFAQMLYYVAVGLEAYGGMDGLKLKARNDLSPINLADHASFYYLVLGFLMATLYLTHRLVRSRFGRVLRGIKDNERRMRSVGFPTYRYKLAAFALGGALAGFAGALHANLNTYVSPAILDWIMSGDLLIMIILGGAGTLYGAVYGAAAYLLLEEVLSGITKHWMLVFGPILLVIVLYAKGGLYGWLAPRSRRDG